MEEPRKPARKVRAKTTTRAAGKPAAKAVAKTPAGRKPAPAAVPVHGEEMVRTAAYFRAERRGFAPGSEWDDWLAAEAEVNALVEAAAVPRARKAPARKAAKPPKGGKA